MMSINVKDNLIDGEERNTIFIENELDNILETNEGQNIKADIETLSIMGFDKKMINKVYILLRPANIERAIDYMTEFDGIYQHNFIANNNPKQKNLCFICKKAKQFHLDYIPENLLNEDFNFNQNNNNQDNIDINNNIFENNQKNNYNDECEVCYEDIDKENKDLNEIPCGHLFCTNCWFNYLKSLIIEAKVDDIKCMDHECKEHISDEFILKHISNKENLVEKFNKFKKRAEIIKDKNKKICPNPNCDSFLQKSKDTLYVECQNGHKYCFECLQPPHGNKSCDYQIEKQFMNWMKGKRVKRCPRCQIYTEKNEGCNHMTCVCCKYQWCWLCEKQYNYGHYDSGTCAGHQFTKANYLSEIKQGKNEVRIRNIRNSINGNYFGLHKIFTCVFKPVERQIEFNELSKKYLLMIVFWFFGVWMIYFYNIFGYFDDKLPELGDGFPMFFSFFIALGILVAFQIIFASIITPFILISFIYPRFFNKVLLFFEVGND